MSVYFFDDLKSDLWVYHVVPLLSHIRSYALWGNSAVAGVPEIVPPSPLISSSAYYFIILSVFRRFQSLSNARNRPALNADGIMYLMFEPWSVFGKQHIVAWSDSVNGSV